MAQLRLYLICLLLYTLIGFGGRLLFSAFFAQWLLDVPRATLYGAWLFGLRFDLALAALMAFVVTVVATLLPRGQDQRLRGAIPAAVLMAVLVVLMVSDVLYFAESGRHLGYELKLAMGDYSGAFGSALRNEPLMTLGGIGFIGLVAAAMLKSSAFRPLGAGRWAQASGMILLLLVATIILVKSGVRGLPLNPSFAYQVGDPKGAQVALNGAYNATYILIVQREALQKVPIAGRQDSDHERRLVADMHNTTRANQVLSAPKAMNVVFVLLESWSATRMQSYGGEALTTPQFDALQSRGLSVAGMLAGGRRTPEGVFATLASYQNPLGQSLARSELERYEYHSWVSRLGKSGWDSAFVQGSHRETVGTGALAQKLGFRASYGKTDYGDGQYPHNAWGWHDPDIYRFSIEKAKSMTEPFVLGINTNTTHDLSLPPNVDAKFGMDSHQAALHSTLYFADSALGGFIERYESQPWRLPTLFVLVADHTAWVKGSIFDQYRVPFALFSDDATIAKRHLKQIVSHRDIAPTVLDALGADAEGFSGRSLLVDTPSNTDFYHNQVLGWVRDQKMIELDLQNDHAVTSYALVGPYLIPEPSPMTEAHQAMVEAAKAFTGRSQDYLFDGRTAAFFEEINEDR